MNSMSLLRNLVIVGGATFLVGSALMEISKGDEKVGWWPYAATFLSGALGYYVVKQKTVPVPEALELNAEYDFKNKAMITVVADEEDEAWEKLHELCTIRSTMIGKLLILEKPKNYKHFPPKFSWLTVKSAEEPVGHGQEAPKKDMLTKMPFHIPKFMITHQGKVGAITEVMSQCIRLKIPTTLAICPKAITCTCLNRL